MTAPGTWTEQVRVSALDLARIAVGRHRDTDRALRHVLSSAVAHGVTVDELATATGLDRGTVHALTVPAVTG